MSRDDPATCPACGNLRGKRKYIAGAHPPRTASFDAIQHQHRPDIRRLLPAIVLVAVLALAGLAIVKLALWGIWGKWIEGKATVNFNLDGWPIPYWGRLGKVLQFVAGLTVLLDLAGEERVDRWHSTATINYKRNKELSRTLLPRTVRPWKAQVGRFAWVTVPVCGVANGVLLYYLLVHLFHFGPTFTLCIAIAAALLSFVVVAVGVSGESVFTAYFIYSIFVSVSALVGFFLYGFPSYSHMPWWSVGILKDGGPVLLVAILSAATYLAVMSFVLLVVLFIRLAVSAIVMASTTALAWALHKEARPLRWIALIFLLVGFHFDLLAT